MKPERLYNPLVLALLRSRLHGLISGAVMEIQVVGRRSGRVYATPVQYLRDGNSLIVVTKRNRTWWRNLRAGGTVAVRLRGKLLKGRADLVEDPDGVAAGFRTALQLAPSYQRAFGIKLAADGRPEDEQRFRQVANPMVIVRISDLAG